MIPSQTEAARTTASTLPPHSGGQPTIGAQGEPTTLLAVRQPKQGSSTHVTSAELRERDAVVRAGLWGVGLSTLAVLVVSALMGLMRG